MILAERIKAIEQRGTLASRGASAGQPRAGGAEALAVLRTGWSSIDDALGGGLLCGALHEWLGIASASAIQENASRSWTPPVGPLVHLAWQFLVANQGGMQVVWIGDSCFPYPRVLVRPANPADGAEGSDFRLLERSVFVSARDPHDRVWAADLAIRSPAVGLVIADGSRFDMAATRRIQLVAKAHGVLALIVRPPWERGELSAAQTRWLLRWDAPLPGEGGMGGQRRAVRFKHLHGLACRGSMPPAAGNPRWSVELLRCKGRSAADSIPASRRWAARSDDSPSTWVLEWNRATCLVHLCPNGELGTAGALGDSLFPGGRPGPAGWVAPRHRRL